MNRSSFSGSPRTPHVPRPAPKHICTLHSASFAHSCHRDTVSLLDSWLFYFEFTHLTLTLYPTRKTGALPGSSLEDI